MGKFYRKYLLLVLMLFAFCGQNLRAQYLLNKQVSVNAHNALLADVLKSVAKQGGFYFSYSGDVVPETKTVSLSMSGRSVRQVLDALLDGKYQYRERDNYIIIQEGDGYVVSGYVIDKKTGDKISYASVYEKQQLVSTITNEQGYFKLKLKDKDKYPVADIAVSKGMYEDTFMQLKPGFDQVLTVSITPKDYQLDSIVVKPKVERNWLAGIFLSSKQRFQSANIGGYIASRPVQTSFVPGVGTHGRLGAQVVNKFSLNVLGGYTAGAKGVEVGGLFNIDKGDVGYVQVGGLFNVVGGKTSGVQVAGLYNSTLDSLNGIQLSGLSSFTNGNLKGVQVSGLYSHVTGNAKGLQIAGLVNMVPAKMYGAQVAGIGSVNAEAITGTQIGGVFTYAEKISGTQVSGTGNIVTDEVDGVQVTGIFNYAGKLKGTQVGLVNIADTSSGYSVGLINVVFKNGYHKLSLYTNEVTNTNLALKTGTKKLYSILTAGANIEKDKKAYALAIGLGQETFIAKRFGLNTDATAGILYLGEWKETATILRFVPALNFKLTDYITFHAGPSFSLYYQNSTVHVEGYKASIPGYDMFRMGSAAAWIGWQGGIDIF